MSGRRSSSQTPASTEPGPGPIPETKYSARYESFRPFNVAWVIERSPYQHRQSGRGDIAVMRADGPPRWTVIGGEAGASCQA